MGVNINKILILFYLYLNLFGKTLSVNNLSFNNILVNTG